MKSTHAEMKRIYRKGQRASAGSTTLLLVLILAAFVACIAVVLI